MCGKALPYRQARHLNHFFSLRGWALKGEEAVSKQKLIGKAEPFRTSGGGAAFKEDSNMQLGMIGLGRMGANMVRRLMRGGHECVVWDVSADNIKKLAAEGATGGESLEDFIAQAGRAVPMGRMGRAEEFANVATFLASDAASYVTGCAINVDGGRSPVV